MIGSQLVHQSAGCAPPHSSPIYWHPGGIQIQVAVVHSHRLGPLYDDASLVRRHEQVQVVLVGRTPHFWKLPLSSWFTAFCMVMQNRGLPTGSPSPIHRSFLSCRSSSSASSRIWVSLHAAHAHRVRGRVWYSPEWVPIVCFPSHTHTHPRAHRPTRS